MEKTVYILLLALCLLTSCKNKQNAEDAQEMEKADVSVTDLYVDTLRLYYQTFHRQLVCNGKLEAIEKSELAFNNGGTVVAIHVHNGDFVRKGQIIAETDKQDCLLEIEKSKKDLEKAKVELTDKLIGLGYSGNTNEVPTDVLNRAKVTSGFFTSQYALQTAENQLKGCNLRAPFSGRIADLNNNRHQKLDKVCTLINDSYFDVEFNVMEAELKNIRRGQQVSVMPFTDNGTSYKGTILNVNPTVDDKGLILVKARIKNVSNKLIDGMNVRVIIENDAPHSLVVPKDAVVERDGYHVVFIYKDGEAIWTYVDIAYSNLGSHAITGCERKGTEIHQGDVVITTGNQNLADGTKVKVRTKAKE